MSLVGSYGSHLLHSFHPHLLQTLNHHGMLANGNAAAAASYFAGERGALSKPAAAPSVLTNFQLPSAFSPPKYIGISLDQVGDPLAHQQSPQLTRFLLPVCRTYSMAMNRSARTRPVRPAHRTSPWRGPMTTTARRAKVLEATPPIPGT